VTYPYPKFSKATVYLDRTIMKVKIGFPMRWSNNKEGWQNAYAFAEFVDDMLTPENFENWKAMFTKVPE
jgi:hypothetical protein